MSFEPLIAFNTSQRIPDQVACFNGTVLACTSRTAMSLNRKKDKQTEHKQLKKFLELGRDPLKRLKWLSQGLGE